MCKYNTSIHNKAIKFCGSLPAKKAFTLKYNCLRARTASHVALFSLTVCSTFRGYDIPLVCVCVRLSICFAILLLLIFSIYISLRFRFCVSQIQKVEFLNSAFSLNTYCFSHSSRMCPCGIFPISILVCRSVSLCFFDTRCAATYRRWIESCAAVFCTACDAEWKMIYSSFVVVVCVKV